MTIKVGDEVYSYDFAGRDDCYVHGVVEAIKPYPGCVATCPHYHIKTKRRIVEGVEESEFAEYYYPPCNDPISMVVLAGKPNPWR